MIEGVRIILFLFIFSGVRGMINHISVHRLISRGIEDIYLRLSAASDIRDKDRKQLISLYGEYNGRSLLGRVDEQLRYSGVCDKFPWLTTEIYLTYIITVSALILIVTIIATGNLLLAAGVVIIFIMLSDYVMERRRKKRFLSVQEQLLNFINSVDSYSAAEDDLIDILGKSARVSEGVIREEILRAVTKAKSSGDSSEVLREIEDRIEHPFFRMLIRNLGTASKNSANYGLIIEECRNILQEQLENSRQLHDIYKVSRYKIGMVGVGGTVSIILMGTMILGCNMEEFFHLMMSGRMGRILMFLVGAVFLVSVYYAVLRQERRW